MDICFLHSIAAKSTQETIAFIIILKNTLLPVTGLRTKRTCSLQPANDAGLSPVKATTLQSVLKP